MKLSLTAVPDGVTYIVVVQTIDANNQAVGESYDIEGIPAPSPEEAIKWTIKWIQENNRNVTIHTIEIP